MIRLDPRQLYKFRKIPTFYGENLLAPRPTPKLEDHPFRLSATAYLIYSQLPSILEDVSPSAASGTAMPW